MKGIKKMFIFVPLALIIVLLCFYVFHYNLMIVKSAPFTIKFKNNGQLSSTCYYVKGDILMVVTALQGIDSGNEKNKNFEAYLIDIKNHTIGVPSFSSKSYHPLGYFAFVDYLVLEGVPGMGELEAIFEEDNDVIHIKMVGPSDVAKSIEPGSFRFYKHLMLYDCEFEMIKDK